MLLVAPLKSGEVEYINITATVLGNDATNVTVDLGAIAGQIDGQEMTFNGVDEWYYNFTVIEDLATPIDGTSGLRLDAIDDGERKIP